jgi:hypothetical protein
LSGFAGSNKNYNDFNADNNPKKIKWGGKTVLHLSNGDYIYPRFSPNGRFLAYAESLLVQQKESTAIYLYDFKTKTRRILLGSKQANQYATYRAFVVDIKWLGNEFIEAALSDGDVDTNVLTISVTSNKIVKEKTISAGEDGKVATMANTLNKLYPDVEREVFQSAIDAGTTIKIRGGVILQKNYSGQDHHIWFYGTKKKQVRKILPLDASDSYALGGGIQTKNQLIFAINSSGKSYLIQYRKPNTVKPLAVYKSARAAWIITRLKTPSVAYFTLLLNESYQKGHNPIFRFSRRQGLLEIAECQLCYDFDVDKQQKRLAITYWSGKKRELRILKK